MRIPGEPAFVESAWVAPAIHAHPEPVISRPVDASVQTYEPCPPLIHFHRWLELGVVLAGRMAFQFEGFHRVLTPGEVWLCGPWEPHAATPLPPLVTVLTATFQPDFLEDRGFEGKSWLGLFAAPAEERPWVATAAARREVLSLCKGLCREIEERPTGWKTGLRLDVLRLLLLLARCSGKAWPAAPRPRATDLSRLMPALELLHQDASRPPKRSEAAAACALSESRFAELFHRAMGVSFSRHRLRIRLVIAAQRLVVSDLPIETIAREAGFVDSSHLDHVFLRHYGCTPSQFRRRGQLQGPTASPTISAAHR